jgi:glutathione S-transferase
VPAGPLGRTRLLEALAFISTEVHKAYKPFYVPSASDANRAKAGATIARRLEFLTANLRGPYLLGSRFTVADAYLFVTLTWRASSA